MINPALIFIYNHCHPENIDPLERMYGKRFKDIYHLMPFYEGDKSGNKNVIPVYDNSYYFHSFIPQGLKDYYKEEYTHYIFVADDYLLNPRINAENFLEWFGLSSQAQDSCFLPSPFSNVGSSVSSYPSKPWAYNYSPHIWGLDAQKELPSFDEALSRFQELGLDTSYFRQVNADELNSFYYDKNRFSYRFDAYHKAVGFINKPNRGRKILGQPWSLYFHPLWVFYALRNKFSPYKMSYPLACGYSDVFVIPANQIKCFAKYCAIFAASNLFVDFSIPTAMILLGCPVVFGNTRGFNKISDTSNMSDLKFLTARPNAYVEKKFPLEYKNQINALLSSYPRHLLGLHPIKLSQWNMDLSKESLKLLGH